MGFNFDPDKAFKFIEDIKAAYAKAADAETGNAKPAFAALERNFNNMLNDAMNASEDEGTPDYKKIAMKMLPSMIGLQMAFNQTAVAAKTNPAAAAALDAFKEDIKAATQNLIGGFNLPFPGLGSSRNDNEPPKPAKPDPKKYPPKRPRNGGSLDF
jgi:hypothetical protein